MYKTFKHLPTPIPSTTGVYYRLDYPYNVITGKRLIPGVFYVHGDFEFVHSGDKCQVYKMGEILGEYDMDILFENNKEGFILFSMTDDRFRPSLEYRRAGDEMIFTYKRFDKEYTFNIGRPLKIVQWVNERIETWEHDKGESRLIVYDLKLQIYLKILTQLNLPVHLVYLVYLYI